MFRELRRTVYELIRLIMLDAIVEADTIRPVFKPPFDIIHRIGTDARALELSLSAKSLADTNVRGKPTNSTGVPNTTKVSEIPSDARSVLLPERTRTF